MLFPTLKTNFGVKKKSGGVWIFFFFRKTILSHFTLYAIFNIKKILKSAPSLLVKWEVVSPNSREGQLESIYTLCPLFPCSDFVSQMLGGGGCNVFLTFYAISNISRKQIWEYKTIISHLMFSSWFFCMLEILPSLTATG